MVKSAVGDTNRIAGLRLSLGAAIHVDDAERAAEDGISPGAAKSDHKNPAVN